MENFQSETNNGEQNVSQSVSGNSTLKQGSIKPVMSFIESEDDLSETSNPQSPIAKPTHLWKKVLVPFIAIALIIIIAAAGVFAYSANQNNKPIPTTSLLPADPNLVVLATINPESQQFKILQSNLEKFPGYKENVSNVIENKLKIFNFDFEKELLPSLGDKAYFIINDLSPLSANLPKEKINDVNLRVGENENQDFLDTLSSEKNPTTDEFEKSIKQLNFISAIEIKDLKKAEELLKKMQADSNLTISSRTYKDFVYFEIIDKKATDNQEKIYSTVAGKNLLLSSDENELKGALDKGENFKFSLAKKKEISSLADNVNLKTMFDYFNSSVNNDQILSMYVKLNTQTFNKNAQDQYIKYPDDLIYGVDLRANQDGIGINIASNALNLKSIKNISFTDGLAAKIPQQANEKWADIFSETANTKEMYYDVKQNYLSEKGKENLQSLLNEINKSLNIDIEKDIIDQITGNVGLAIFTKENVQPDVTFIMQINDGTKMQGTIQTIIDNLKSNMLESYSITAKTPQQKQAIQKKLDESYKLTTNETPQGKIYTLSFPESSLSLNYAVENSTLIISSNASVIQTLTQSFLDGNQNTIIKNALYARAAQNAVSQGYSQSFIVTQGLINIFSYFTHSAERELRADEKSLSDESDSDIAIKSILKTIKTIKTTNSVNGQFLQYSIFFDIKEIPEAEKEKAAKAIENLRTNKKEISKGSYYDLN